MNRIITIFLFITAGLIAGDQATQPDITQKAVDCEFRAWYIEKGTRSEGIHGELLISGKTMIGQKKGAIMTCALGDFIWHGPKDERKVSWDRSGWLPKDIETIYPSWKQKTTEPNQRLQTMRIKLPMNAIAQGPHV